MSQIFFTLLRRSSIDTSGVGDSVDKLCLDVQSICASTLCSKLSYLHGSGARF